MTIEDRYVIGVEDLQALRFVCQCGASLSAAVESWTRVPNQCPKCDAMWGIAGTPLAKLAGQFLAILRQMKAMGDTEAFSIRFELERPKA